MLSGAFGSLMHLPDVIAVLQNPFVNAASVIETAVNGGIVNVGFPLLTNVLAPVAQLGLTGQAIYDGFRQVTSKRSPTLSSVSRRIW